MDALIAAAGRALASGDALGALKRIALREDPPALALHGIAMAQLGELPRARELLRLAARGFGRHEALAGARCTVAAAEVALAMRDLDRPTRALDAAIATLEKRGDTANAAHARLVSARRSLLLGRLGEARAQLIGLEGMAMRPAPAAIANLCLAELALRSLQIDSAREALERAHAAALRAVIPALVAEVEAMRDTLHRPAARQRDANGERTLQLDQVAALYASGALVIDGCRLGIRMHDAWLPLARRPVLFTLAATLAAAWPGDADRDALIATAFRIRRVDETHRARLRVELGRLRALVEPWAAIEATARGFELVPRGTDGVALLIPPFDGEQASLLALLSDGEAWSTSAIALALGTGQRTVQRALAELESAGSVRAVGRARSRRWLAASLGGFATTLLLPAPLPSG